MELRQIRYFLATAEAKSFRRGAERLHITQPALSRQVALLEGELGVRVFERTRRGIELTQAGIALVQETRKVLTLVDKSIATARQAAGFDIDLLRLGLPTTSLPLIADLLKRLNDRYPGLDLEIHEGLFSQHAESLRSGALDAAFVWGTASDEDSLEIHPIRTFDIGMLVGSSHPMAGRGTARLEDFASDRFLIPSQALSPAWCKYLVGHCQRAGFEPIVGPNGVDAYTRDTLSVLVVSEGAVAFWFSELGQPQMGCEVLRLSPPIPGYLSLMWRRGDRSAVVGRLVQLADEAVAESMATTSPASIMSL